MTKKKPFDCVKFKDELFAKTWKKSRAKDGYEFAEYVNTQSRKSIFFKNQDKVNITYSTQTSACTD